MRLFVDERAGDVVFECVADAGDEMVFIVWSSVVRIQKVFGLHSIRANFCWW